MEIRHLRYFVAVAEELHFGRAAERLFIAQPPLSQQIQQLERELGVALFERTSRRVRLTPAGAVFLQDALHILARVQASVQDARRAAKGELGTLAIGFVASATYDFLPRVLRRFREQYPDIELLLSEQNAAEQSNALREKTIHVGFARPAIEAPEWVAKPITHEPFLLAVPEHHALAAMPAVALPELAAEPFIAFPPDPKPSYADLVKAVCEAAGFSPLVAQEVREMQTALSLVAAGMGVCLVPASVQNVQRRGVVYCPLTGLAPTTDLSVVYRKDDPSPVLALFLDTMQENATPQILPTP